MYITKHFILEELCHPDVVKDYGVFGWNLLDEGLLKVLDHLRGVFGSIKVNDYVYGGNYKDSGLRTTFGSATSMHREGRAFDIKAKHATPREVCEYIMDNQKIYYDLGLRRIEDTEYTPSWLHLDSKDKKGYKGKVYIFRP